MGLNDAIVLSEGFHYQPTKPAAMEAQWKPFLPKPAPI